MNKLITYLFLIIFCCSIIACSDDNNDANEFSFVITPATMNFTPEGGKTKLEIEITPVRVVHWDVVSTVEWCKYYYDEYPEVNNNRYIVVEPNTTGKKRETKVEFVIDGEVSRYISVTQDGWDASELKVSVDRVDILSNGDSPRFSIEADGAWRITKYPDWCRMDRTAYFGDFSALSISAKQTEKIREGEFIVEYGNNSISIPIKQWGRVEAYLHNTAGQLARTFYEKDLYNTVEVLKLSGRLNSSDYDIFRKIQKLRELDVSEIELANGRNAIPPFFSYACNKLERVILPPNILSIGDGAFMSCPLLKTVVIPESVTYIEMSAFGHCTSLTDITIPSKVTSIGSGAFMLCPLQTIHSKNPNPPVGVGGVFDPKIYSTCILYVPKGSKSAYQSKEYWSRFKNIVEE